MQGLGLCSADSAAPPFACLPAHPPVPSRPVPAATWRPGRGSLPPSRRRLISTAGRAPTLTPPPTLAGTAPAAARPRSPTRSPLASPPLTDLPGAWRRRRRRRSLPHSLSPRAEGAVPAAEVAAAGPEAWGRPRLLPAVGLRRQLRSPSSPLWREASPPGSEARV